MFYGVYLQKRNTLSKDLSKRNRTEPKEIRFTVKEPSELMSFLLHAYNGKSRNAIKSLLSHRQIAVDGQVVTKYDYQLQPKQIVSVQKGLVPQQTHYSGLKIVYEDPHLIVINKDSGLLSIAADPKSTEPTAYSLLREHVKISSPKNKIFVVHRIDRDTSGLMIYAKSEEVKERFQHAWLDCVEERVYTVIVEGQVKDDTGTITSWLKENAAYNMYSSNIPNDGELAITKYTVLQRSNDYTLLQATLETGRKNQIRVHMKDLGHPIVGDKKYGSKINPMHRLGLHASVLKFKHPITGKVLEFSTSVPRRFQYLIKNNQ